MENLFAFSPLVMAAIPVVMGLVQAIKTTGIPDQYLPVSSIVLGVGAMSLTGITWQAMIVQGIIVGLAASGLWSQGRTVGQAIVAKFSDK